MKKTNRNRVFMQVLPDSNSIFLSHVLTINPQTCLEMTVWGFIVVGGLFLLSSEIIETNHIVFHSE